MALTEYLSVPFLISLGITLLLVGIVGMFFTQRLHEQNHKINTMFGLVTTMAEEITFLRNSLHSLPHEKQTQVDDSLYNSGFEQKGGKESILIEVSDGENDESDDDDDDDDNDDESDDDDTVPSMMEDIVQLIEIVEEVKESEGDNNLESESNIKVINIHEPLSSIEFTNSDINEINDENDDDDDDDDDDESSDSSSECNESINLVELDDADSAIKLNEIDPLTGDSIEKQINMNYNLFDYKKMSLNQLRNIVSEKGLAEDVSKLKKFALIKLLES
jgi:hypothetical protein